MTAPLENDMEVDDDRLIREILAGVESAFDELDDRIAHGDYKVVNKAIERVPMSGRDVAWCAAVFIDKRQVLSHQPTSIVGSVDGRLSEYLAKFEALGKTLVAKSIEGEVISVTTSDTTPEDDS